MSRGGTVMYKTFSIPTRLNNFLLLRMMSICIEREGRKQVRIEFKTSDTTVSKEKVLYVTVILNGTCDK